MALKNELNCKNNNLELCRENEIGQGWEGKTLLPQQVQELNDATAIDCGIVTNTPRGDMH